MNHSSHSLYHRMLRISLVVMAVVLIFDSGLASPITQQLSSDTQTYMASVIGVGAAVEPNEINTITAELTAQRNALEEREAAVAAREIEVGVNSGIAAVGSNAISTYVLSTLLFIILTLIILNYIMDFMRERHMRVLAGQSTEA